MQFVINNWLLFLALFAVLGMLIVPPLRQRLSGVKNVSPADAVRMINRQAGAVIDVREPAEYKTGHIPDSMNVPLSNLATHAKQLAKYKDRPLILACRSGNRSVTAAMMLRKQGFDQVYSLAGGMIAWERDNLPTAK
ncbi:MAG: rhodanese-like domain-containing protein [Gammaproteobacteria bacterium]